MGRKKQENPISRTKEYRTWSWMKSRCLNENAGNYKYYGGRGITVCERWMKFENFLEDMGIQPDRSSLYRIDCNGDYSPENCKWSTHLEQMNNTRASRRITYGSETHTISEWSKKTGVPVYIITKRIDAGLKGDDVFDKTGIRKYDTSSEKASVSISIDRLEWLKIKTIGFVMKMNKNEIIELAVRDFNKKNKEVLG